MILDVVIMVVHTALVFGLSALVVGIPTLYAWRLVRRWEGRDGL